MKDKKWKLTEKGIRVWKKCQELLPVITKLIDNDSYFRLFSEVSTERVDKKDVDVMQKQ